MLREIPYSRQRPGNNETVIVVSESLGTGRTNGFARQSNPLLPISVTHIFATRPSSHTLRR